MSRKGMQNDHFDCILRRVQLQVTHEILVKLK